MTYPAAGIAVSTGSAWTTSIPATGAGAPVLMSTANSAGTAAATALSGGFTTAGNNGGTLRVLNTSTTTGAGLSLSDTMSTAGQFDLDILRTDATNHQMPVILLQNGSDNSGASASGSIQIESQNGTSVGYILGNSQTTPYLFESSAASSASYIILGSSTAGLTAIGADLYFNANLGGKGAATTGITHFRGTSNTDTLKIDNFGVMHQAATALPTASSGTVTTGSTNQAGGVTGLSAATSLTVTFNASGAFATSAWCTYSTSAADSAGGHLTHTGVTSFTITFGAAYTGNVDYVCHGL